MAGAQVADCLAAMPPSGREKETAPTHPLALPHNALHARAQQRMRLCVWHAASSAWGKR